MKKKEEMKKEEGKIYLYSGNSHLGVKYFDGKPPTFFIMGSSVC